MYTTENVVEKSFRLKKNDLNIDIVDLASETVVLEENNILTVERKADTFNFPNNTYIASKKHYRKKQSLFKEHNTDSGVKSNLEKENQSDKDKEMDFLLGQYFEEILNNVPQVDMKRRDNDENVEGSISCETVESMEGQEEVDTKTLKTLTK